jgi:uncharacterized NAD-dependent epimerase/dehydratase family protein
VWQQHCHHTIAQRLFLLMALLSRIHLSDLKLQGEIMCAFFEGNAIVYSEGAFDTPNGKTAHGLIRRTSRYKVLSVVDSHYVGRDAGEILGGHAKNVPIFSDIQAAFDAAKNSRNPANFMVIGLAPDGGRLSSYARDDVKKAIRLGLNIDSGLHDFLSEDSEISTLARQFNVSIRDVRKTPPRNRLHFFSGKIKQVDALKIAVLGTDSAVGKRTTAWLILEAMIEAGYSTEFIGTGQTAWLQGAKYSIILDSIINDFVSGEIEHAVWSAWNDSHPDVIVIEGQGSLMNPAYPGGFEILAAGRPDVVVLQHAPARKDYDGFPGYPIHPLEQQIQAIQLISGKPVIAITINHENIPPQQAPIICDKIYEMTGLPAVDVLWDGAGEIVTILKSCLK